MADVPDRALLVSAIRAQMPGFYELVQKVDGVLLDGRATPTDVSVELLDGGEGREERYALILTEGNAPPVVCGWAASAEGVLKKLRRADITTEDKEN